MSANIEPRFVSGETAWYRATLDRFNGSLVDLLDELAQVRDTLVSHGVALEDINVEIETGSEDDSWADLVVTASRPATAEELEQRAREQHDRDRELLTQLRVRVAELEVSVQSEADGV